MPKQSTITQYFTYRPFNLNGGVLSIQSVLENSFKGMNFTYALNIAENNQIDSRILGSITSESQDEIDVILEGLAFFAVHKKTTVSAKEFWQKMTNQTIQNKNGILSVKKDA